MYVFPRRWLEVAACLENNSSPERNKSTGMNLWGNTNADFHHMLAMQIGMRHASRDMCELDAAANPANSCRENGSVQLV